MKKIFIAGSVNMDLVIGTDVFPDAGETVSGRDFITNPGGKGANQAVAVSKNGGEALMVGAVGREFGDELIKTLEGYGVKTEFVKKEGDISSGIAVIIVHDGDNRIVLDEGANGRVDIAHIENALKTSSAGDFYITQMEIPLVEMEKGLKLAKEKGLVTVLNPAPAKKISEEVLSFVDYFVPNQTETEFYTGVYPKDEETARVAAKILMEKGVKTVIMTLGSKGAMAFDKEGEIFVPSFKVEAIDTTAAGDTFVGATVTRLSKGDSLKEAMTYANKASSITVTRRGAQQSIPYEKEVVLK